MESNMFFKLFLQLARSSQIKMQYARKPMLETKVICTVCPDNMKQAEPVRLNREQASKHSGFVSPGKKQTKLQTSPKQCN